MVVNLPARVEAPGEHFDHRAWIVLETRRRRELGLGLSGLHLRQRRKGPHALGVVPYVDDEQTIRGGCGHAEQRSKARCNTADDRIEVGLFAGEQLLG